MPERPGLAWTSAITSAEPLLPCSLTASSTLKPLLIRARIIMWACAPSLVKVTDRVFAVGVAERSNAHSVALTWISPAGPSPVVASAEAVVGASS